MIALMGLALAAGDSSATVNALGGSCPQGAWTAQVSAGFPYQGLRAQVGLAKGWSPTLAVDTVLGRDSWFQAGVAKRWVDRPGVVFSAEALLGAQLRVGELSRKGPSAEFTLNVARGQGRWVPYAQLSSRHTLSFERTLIRTEEEQTSSVATSHHWSPLASVGVGFAIAPGVGLDLGLDQYWLEPPGLTLPGAHLALHFGRGAQGGE